MKIIKRGMRLWITAASLLSFLTGWVFFAHSNKPAPLQIEQPAPVSVTVEQPFQPQRLNPVSRQSPFTIQPQTRIFQPRLRTGGS